MSIDSHLRYLIGKNGYVTIEELMREALSASHESYYQSTKVFGQQGDFITAPEISQLFGEIIALWAIEQWQELGSPSKFYLLELGSGQGKLLRDFLSVAKLVPDFFKALNIIIHDINPYFIKLQKQYLKNYLTKICWSDNLTSLLKPLDRSSNKPLIIIANEFFDALPIRQYLNSKNTWYERVIISDPDHGPLKYHQIELKRNLQEQLKQQHPKAGYGAIIEESVESLNIIRFLASHLVKLGGAAVIIDYGYHIPISKRNEGQYHNSLQAISKHKYCPVLENIGKSDLTAHVDFDALARAARERNINNVSLSLQSEFLIKYGILLRAESLKKSLHKKQSDDKLTKSETKIIDRQISRLISPQQMGELFKVLELKSIGLKS